MRIDVTLSAVLAALTVVSAASAADPEQPPKLSWPGARYRPSEAAVTAAFALEAAAVSFAGPPSRRWEGGVLFDDAIRDGLRLRTPGARAAAGRTSDVLYYALIAFPVIADVGITAAGVHRSPDVALQVLAIDVESYAVAGAIALSAEKVGRARPMASECARDPSYDAECSNAGNLNASFVSGHTTLAFTGAGLVCAHHRAMPLYGGGAADGAACAGALALATTAGMFRILSDRHYASDVLLGTGVGLASGYLLPWLLHYRGHTGAIVPHGAVKVGGVRFDTLFTPSIGPGGAQLGFVSIF